MGIDPCIVLWSLTLMLLGQSLFYEDNFLSEKDLLLYK